MQNIKSKLKKVGPIRGAWDFVNGIISLNRRLTYLEQRFNNFRWYAVEQAADYLVGAQVEGDYCEFGVYKGDTFAHMMRYHHVFPSMRFFAFDSFEGLPAPTGIDNENGYASNFHEGEFAVAEDAFRSNLKRRNLPMDKVITVKGWFDKTLTPETAKTHNLNKVSIAWIDCDFYESTVPVLDFLLPRLSIGSLLIFDDWKVYRNMPDKGQQRAVAEWLKQNPGLSLAEIYDFSHHGRAFTVSGLPV